jgi:predicted cobalt transporter CbtA
MAVAALALGPNVTLAPFLPSVTAADIGRRVCVGATAALALSRTTC